LFDYKHLLLLGDIGDQCSYSYLNVVHFINTRSDYKSVAA